MQRDTGIHMKGGVITERDADYCTVRLRAPAGSLSLTRSGALPLLQRDTATARSIAPPARHLRSRMSKGISSRNLAKALEKNGTPIGSEKDEIVNIIACPGTERCKFANIDTISLAKKIDAKLFGKEMPVKMRIALSGCPNACTSPMLNEIGVIGRVKPVRTKERLCTGCGNCVYYCKENAIRIRNGISVLDESKCVQCGVCVQSCHFDLVKVENRHYLITVGGRRGRHPKIGRNLLTVETEDQVLFVIEKIVDWVYRRAWSGRLLSEQLDDIHFEKFREDILKKVPEAKPVTDEKNKPVAEV